MSPPVPDALPAQGRVSVFGQDLVTDQPLPGLPVVVRVDGHSPFWDLRTASATVDATQHTSSSIPVGRLNYGNDVAVTLAGTASGSEIVFSDTGRFELDPDARHIMHHVPPVVDRSAVALDLIGVVLPYALHVQGAWCVHASAVSMRDGVVAFIAPRGTGKSTLAAACVQRGCALVADDVVVLRAGPHGIEVTPAGLPLRLRAEAARALGSSDEDRDAWGKVRVSSQAAIGTLRLAACYVLAAVTPETAVSRVSRSARAAAIALLTNGKITELLGADSTGDALSRCIDLAAGAPMFDLAVPRALDQLDAVTAQLLAWHNGPAATAAGDR